MPVLAKFYGIVIRLLCVQTLGARLHAFYDGNELIVSIWPVRIVGGEAPTWVKEKVLSWAAEHQEDLIQTWHRCLTHQKPLAIAAYP